MSKKFIAVSLAVMLVGLFSTAAMAGVEGDFEFDISLRSQLDTTQTGTAESLYQMSNFDTDFEGLLDFDVTLSGLTIGNDLAFGVAGLEHYIATLETTLGALSIKDEFAFAVPFGKKLSLFMIYKGKQCYIGTYDYKGSESTIPTELQNLGADSDGEWYYNVPGSDVTACATALAPSGKTWGDIKNDVELVKESDYYPYDSLQFVKKRVTAEMTLAGLDLETLVLFEDSNFGHPISVDTSQTASYQFGSIFTLTGETVGGISITNKTGFQANWLETMSVGPKTKYVSYAYNKIKKHTWWQTFQKKDWIQEVLKFEGIKLAGITFDDVFSGHVDFSSTPGTWSFTNYLKASATLFKDFTLEALLSSSSPLSFSFSKNYFTLTTDWGSVAVFDYDGDFALETSGAPSSTDYVDIDFDFDLQAAEFDIGLKTVPTVGLTSAAFGVDIPVSETIDLGVDVNYANRYDYSEATAGYTSLDFDSIDFDLELNNVEITATFGEGLLESANVSITTEFAL